MQVKSLLLYKNGNFWKYFKRKSDQYIHQNAPFFKISSDEHPPEPLCYAHHAASRHAYTSEEITCTPLLNPVMYAHLSLFKKMNLR